MSFPAPAGGGDKMAAAPGGGAMRRVQLVLGHLAASPPGAGTGLRAAPCGSRAGAEPRAASPDDVVVVHGRRTAIGRAKRGGFKVRPGAGGPSRPAPSRGAAGTSGTACPRPARGRVPPVPEPLRGRGPLRR